MSENNLSSETNGAVLPSSRPEDVNRSFRNSVLNALREHEKAGRLVPILRDGVVVHVSPAEILKFYTETVKSGIEIVISEE